MSSPSPFIDRPSSHWEQLPIEQRLRELEAEVSRLRGVVDHAVDAIISIDCNGVITGFNHAAERLFGYSFEEVQGRNIHMLMPEPYSAEHAGYMRRYFETGERRIIGIGRKVDALKKDGTIFPIDLAVSEALIGEERVFTGIVRDLTEQRALMARLTLAERLAAIGELAAGIAHEVNNPVNAMINCAQLILDGDTDKTLCEDIISEGNRIASIVSNLLNFARDHAEQVRPTRVVEVIDRSLALLGRRFQKQGVEVLVEEVGEVPKALVRTQQLQQVILNLIVNARDALLERSTQPEKMIAIRIAALGSPDAEQVEIRVRDNGPGIPEALRARIFDAFFTTKKNRGGTGLGLSVSREIVEAHGGHLSVESEPGAWTEFRILLPAERSTESASQ
ncbi:MAG: PAS domain S-box protein [Planctomycetes bacterium]|nr:PAS domain S-box protein [Planctomycetota bacterium]